MGGPPRYSTLPADQSALLQMHAGNGDMTDLGRRFVECFVAAADDAELPDAPEFRAALRAYMEWAVDDVLAYSAEGSVVPGGVPMPRWSWDGLEEPTGTRR
jgi:hemoglobin